MSQFFVDSSGGGGGVVQSITGNTGGALSSANINVVTANSSVIFAGAGSTETLDFGGTNLLLGNSGSHLTTGINNCCYGRNAGEAITSGQANTLIGFQSGISATGGSSNVGLGENSLFSLTTGAGGAGSNVGIGNSSLGNIITGINNIGVGPQAGGQYFSSESSNICIGSPGVTAENNTIRIGTPGSGVGQQNKFVAAGITGLTVAASSPAAVNSLGQLSDLGFGTSNQVLTSNGAGSSPTWKPSPQPASNSNASVYLANSLNNVTGDGTFVGPVIFDTVLFDLGSNYSTSTGIFTCPNNGQYLVCVNITFNTLTIVNTIGEVRILIGGATFNRAALNPGAVQTGGLYSFGFSIVIPATAGETIQIGALVSGGTKTVGLNGSSFGDYCFTSFTQLS